MVDLSTRLSLKSLVVAAALLAPGAAAPAAELAAYAGKTIELKNVRGTVYYVPRGDAFDVVVTMDSDGHPVRFIASLQPGQATVISTPGAPGEAEKVIEIKRDGDRLSVTDGGRQRTTDAGGPIRRGGSDD